MLRPKASIPAWARPWSLPGLPLILALGWHLSQPTLSRELCCSRFSPSCEQAVQMEDGQATAGHLCPTSHAEDVSGDSAPLTPCEDCPDCKGHPCAGHWTTLAEGPPSLPDFERLPLSLSAPMPCHEAERALPFKPPRS